MIIRKGLRLIDTDSKLDIEYFVDDEDNEPRLRFFCDNIGYRIKGVTKAEAEKFLDLLCLLCKDKEIYDLEKLGV